MKQEEKGEEEKTCHKVSTTGPLRLVDNAGRALPAPPRTRLDDAYSTQLHSRDILEGIDDVEHPILVRPRARHDVTSGVGIRVYVWVCLCGLCMYTRGERAVVRVEDVDAHLAAVAEVRDRVGRERAEVDMALGGCRAPRAERARAERHVGRDRHKVLPAVAAAAAAGGATRGCSQT